jgi:predicted short-subunit dehydrogenase-like oxidoreductase (DUF2520 family)
MPRKAKPTFDVFLYGAGKVGKGLHRALTDKGARATLHSARSGPPAAIDADLVVLAVRDRELGLVAQKLVGVVNPRAVVVHTAGSLDASVLAPLIGACAGLGQMHPMISFASPDFTPSLTGGNLHVQGDEKAVEMGQRVAKLLGMTARTIPGLDTVAYHAAAGLVANGATALAAAGSWLLIKAGVAPSDAPAMLAPLLRSVADNVEHLGFPDALTGPVRRGDADGVAKHLSTLEAKVPKAIPLYVAAAEAQLPLARALGDAPPWELDEVAAVLAKFRGR